ncbi:YolD-like family protein [Paenibacillus sp. 7541]|uniref:YolD-like family protein n=1 Tax=Paenibacillus sp. 7541 TaxID=2026236 RepID=UPI000BA53BA7|nr:YolD-like family protein [Paenibacillus sp. 7541]PAK55403.1 hypothetical protein CHH75_03945 [Paenibacillus sp. 7541]
MTTRKKLEGNGLWESSRMMLPEHKEAIIRYQHEEGRRSRPTLDSQEMELIERALAESFYKQCAITLTIYDEYEDIKLSGIVTSLNTHRREIKFAIRTEDWEWIKVDEIIAVR